MKIYRSTEESRKRSAKYYLEHREECLRKMKERAERDHDKLVEYRKKYYEKNSEKKKAYSHNYYHSHPDYRERTAASTREYQRKHRHEHNMRSREYRKENSGKVNAKRRVRYHNNKAFFAERSKKYLKTTRGRFISYRSSSKDRGIDFNLTFEQFSIFWQKPCHYCGDEILTIGLDRVENSVGYVEGNIVPCCRICNAAKSNISQRDFISKCHVISKRHPI